MIRRLALSLAYDGSRYHGWQHQEEVNSIQQALEHALSYVANHPVTVVCAGRTDAGVHATAQVVHFDTEANRTERAWVFGVNSNLPADIAVLWVKEVAPEFHARFSATARTYRYIIYNHLIRPGLYHKNVSWYYKSLDADKMHLAAQCLVGEHDFNAFRGSGCQAHHAVRTIHHVNVTKRGRMMVVEVKANAFVLHMVRNIVGVLLKVGDGEKELEWIEAVLHSKDRRQAAMTGTSNGLYLVGIDYPSYFNLPKCPKGPLFLE